MDHPFTGSAPLNIFVKYFKPTGGGEQMAFRFAAWLAEKGVPVRVVCGDDRSGGALPHVPLIELGMVNIGRYLKYTLFHRRAARAAKTLSGTHFSFDRVPGCHVIRNGSGLHDRYIQTSYAGMKPLKRIRKKIRRSIDPVNPHLVAMERASYTHSALRRVIVNSRMTAAEVLAAYPETADKLTVIHNGVEKSRYTGITADMRRAARTTLGLPENVRIVGFAGNNFERKGLAVLIEAMALLPPDVHVIVAGNRSASTYAASAASFGVASRLHVLGGVSDMPGFYAALDAFCLPGLYDPFPSVVPESLAAGVPVAASKTTGSSELIRQGENGAVMDEITAPACAEAVKTALACGVNPGYADAVTDDEQMYAAYLDAARIAARP